MAAEDIERDFPLLQRGAYRITSSSTSEYNCFAWTLARNDVWYSPVSVGGYYWPAGLAAKNDAETMIQLFRDEGKFEPCNDGSVEIGFEKIVLCSNNNSITHAARQLPNGSWTSKLGSMEDIEHQTPDMLEDERPDGYGRVSLYMRRPRA